MTNEVVIYTTPELGIQVEVKFEGETVWLNQYQLVELFNSSRSNIVEHIKEIYKTEELVEKATCRKFRQVRKEGNRSVERQIDHYNLDVIIALGYRINSKRGTQFRQWATQRLKDYLVKGHAINQKRLDQLQQTIQFISQNTEDLQLTEAKGLLEIIQNYARSFNLLNQYDSQTLNSGKLDENITYEIR